MSMISARLASSVARSLPKAAQQVLIINKIPKKKKKIYKKNVQKSVKRKN